MFALVKIPEVSIKKPVYCLKIDNKTPFMDFFESCKTDSKLRTQLGHVQSILMSIGKDEEEKIPQKKFKMLRRNRKDPHIDYEIKTRDLRVYLFRDKSLGKIVVLGGNKKTQTKDIKKLRRLKNAYFKQQDIDVKLNN